MRSSARNTRRPMSPNIQIYRPQLTSVLSIANRTSGVVASAGAIGLVLWLVAAAAGPSLFFFICAEAFVTLSGMRAMASSSPRFINLAGSSWPQASC